MDSNQQGGYTYFTEHQGTEGKYPVCLKFIDITGK